MRYFIKRTGVFCLMAWLFSSNVNATIYEGNCGDSLLWKFDYSTGHLMIFGKYPGIAARMDDYDVINTGYSFRSNSPWGGKNIQSVSLSDVSHIGRNAFFYCENLTSIYIPKCVTSIGYEAFSCCSGLRQASFASIEHLCSISFENFQANPLVWAHNLYIQGKVTDLVIPDGVTSIGDYAFYNCQGLTSVTIPGNVKSIGREAFEGCTGLGSVILHEGVTTIGFLAFHNCTELIAINIPESVIRIDADAFQGCTGLRKADFANIEQLCNISYGNIESNPLYNAELLYVKGKKITDVIIPESVTTIGSYAFSGCKMVKTITIPESVTTIDSHAFEGCMGPTSIAIPSSVTTIGERAFGGYKGSISIPEGVLSIGDYAFYNCTGLTTVTIPESVTTIGTHAFADCKGLVSVKIEGVTDIGASAFYNCSGLRIAEFASIEQICNISYDGEYSNPTYYSHNLYIGGEEVTDVIIPESVRTTGNYTFFNCTGITTVTIPESVTSIGKFAFKNCSGLTSVTIPNSVISIGKSTFSGCTGLTSVTIPSSITSIDKSTFSGCSSLTSVTIPSSVTSIGDYAFKNCSGLTSVTIPESVISFGSYAFAGCTGELILNCSIPAGVSENNYPLIGTQFTSVKVNGHSIGDYAFYKLSSIKSVELGENMTSIGVFCFTGCSNIESLTLDINCKNLKGWFSGCESSLKSLTLGNQIKTIDSYVFKGFTKLTQLKMPEELEEIGASAFEECKSLGTLTIPISVTNIGAKAFYACAHVCTVKSPNPIPPSCVTTAFEGGTSNAILYVPVGSLDDYYTAPGWSKFYNVQEKDFEDGIQKALSNDVTDTDIYDLFGIKQTKTHKGINIIRRSDGKTTKVLKR